MVCQGFSILFPSSWCVWEHWVMFLPVHPLHSMQTPENVSIPCIHIAMCVCTPGQHFGEIWVVKTCVWCIIAYCMHILQWPSFGYQSRTAWSSKSTLSSLVRDVWVAVFVRLRYCWSLSFLLLRSSTLCMLHVYMYWMCICWPNVHFWPRLICKYWFQIVHTISECLKICNIERKFLWNLMIRNCLEFAYQLTVADEQLSDHWLYIYVHCYLTW